MAASRLRGRGPSRKLGTQVNRELAEYFPSVTRDGTLYFTREDPETRQGGVFRCRYDGERYLEAERLPEQINSTPYVFNAYVTPDESFVIVPTFGREDSYGHADYYVCFRRTDPTSPAGDAWSEPVNLGPRVNTTRGCSRCTTVPGTGWRRSTGWRQGSWIRCGRT